MAKKKSSTKRVAVGLIHVGPEHYDVFEQANPKIDGQDYYGYVKYGTQEITIDSTLKPRKRRNTLFHEAIHAVDNVYGIGLSEKQVKRLEVGLLKLIDDNPELLK